MMRAIFNRLTLIAAFTCIESNALADPPHRRIDQVSVGHDGRGFRMETEDGDFELRLFGIVQADIRDYLRKRDRTDYDRFLVRRARPYLEGRVARAFDYHLMMDLGNGETSLLDAFIDAHIIGDALRFRAGKYKQPFSYEQVAMEDLTLAVFERSMLDAFVPARNVGAMIHGSIDQGRLGYAIGISNGLRDSDFEAKRNEKDFVGRVYARPFRGMGGLSSLQIGISGAYGDESDSFDPHAFTSPMRIRYFEFSDGVDAAGVRLRISPEMAYFAGSWAVAAQFLAQRQRVENHKLGLAPTIIPVTAFYVMTSLVLTGERRTSYAEFIHPQRPLVFEKGWHGTGAIEMVARVSGACIGSASVDVKNGLADSTKVTTQATEVSLGVNWYLSRWVWLMTHFESTFFANSLPLGGEGGARLRNQQALGVRTTVMW